MDTNGTQYDGSNTRTPSRQTLAAAPQRALTFLRALRGNAALRGALSQAGYGEADHEEGLRLLVAAAGYGGAPVDPDADGEARRAGAELHAWAGRHLARLHAAAERLHPEHAWLFEAPRELDAGSALLAVATLLQRLEAVDRGDALFVTLARRGFGDEQRAALARRLQAARAAPPAELAAPSAPDAELLALYRWHRDWATTARALLRRRDWLIALGLARGPCDAH